MIQYKKVIISVAGIIIFLIAGCLTMFLKPAERFETQTSTQEQNKIQTQSEPENKIKVQEDWFVYVTGEVRNPGVYKLSPDSRIFQAVEKAGGFTNKADRNSINMAEKLTSDGLQIYISPKIEQQIQTQNNRNNSVKIPGLQQNNNFNANASGSVIVDINSANAKQLEAVKGIGSVTAKRIIDYRKQHGRFNSVEDLKNVKGIGDKTLEKIRSQITAR